MRLSRTNDGTFRSRPPYCELKHLFLSLQLRNDCWIMLLLFALTLSKHPCFYLNSRQVTSISTVCSRLSSSRGRTEHFKRAQAGCGSSLDAELFEDFEDMLFHRGFAIAKNRCDLTICLTLGKPQ